jgi:hypothetical protein
VATRRRLAALIWVLAWLLMAVAPTIDAQSPTDQAGEEPVPLLDIARVVPYPADFGDLVPGIGFVDGRFYTLEEDSRRAAAAAAATVAAGEDSTTTMQGAHRGLAEASWLQRYESRLAAPSADNPNRFSLQFSSFVVEYASLEDAGSAFATLVDDDRGVASPLVGDESALSLLAGVTPDTGADYQAARLVFRVGPMLGVIVYADLLNQEACRRAGSGGGRAGEHAVGQHGVAARFLSRGGDFGPARSVRCPHWHVDRAL